MWYIITMINELDLLVNNEVKVTSSRSQWFGKTALVRKVMADGRTLEVELAHEHGKVVFIDASLVRDMAWLEPAPHAKGEPDLGPVANSIVQDHK